MFKWLAFLLLSNFLFALPDHVVTYDKGSRFGDNLLCYLHAKWIAYQYQIPLRYKRFKYSSSLVLHDQEMRLSKDPNKDKRIAVGLENGLIDLQREDSVMYTCPYFPEDPWELERIPYYRFKVDWKNQEFRSLARKMIAPKKRLRLMTPPKHSVNIAIHVREGGGYDSESTRLASPLKLPPMSFYRESLSKIVSFFPDQEIRCHIFTDASDPKKIVEILRDVVPPNVKFTYRKSNNSHKKNVLEDFFSLFNFDVLIRSQSNFSMVPSLIHDYAIVCSPAGALIEGDHVIIDKTNLEMNETLYQKLLLRKPSFLSRIRNIFQLCL